MFFFRILIKPAYENDDPGRGSPGRRQKQPDDQEGEDEQGAGGDADDDPDRVVGEERDQQQSHRCEERDQDQLLVQAVPPSQQEVMVDGDVRLVAARVALDVAHHRTLREDVPVLGPEV